MLFTLIKRLNYNERNLKHTSWGVDSNTILNHSGLSPCPN